MAQLLKLGCLSFGWQYNSFKELKSSNCFTWAAAAGSGASLSLRYLKSALSLGSPCLIWSCYSCYASFGSSCIGSATGAGSSKSCTRLSRALLKCLPSVVLKTGSSLSLRLSAFDPPLPAFSGSSLSSRLVRNCS